MRVIITGGTGLIGRALAAELIAGGHEVIALSRSPRLAEGLPAGVKVEGWDSRTAKGWGTLADGAGAIINLAGESIAGTSFLPGRWNDARKKAILDSRLDAGKAVVEAVSQASIKPGVVIQSSGVDYYPADEKQEMTEDSAPANTFLAEVCKQWEASTAAVEAMGVRRCVIRTGVVLARDGGALPRMALPFTMFAGGPIGSGRQPFPWISLLDEVKAIRFLVENSACEGVYNLTAPNPLTNAEFSRVLGKVLGRPAFIPAPGFAFKAAFGEVSQLLLEGRRAVPRRLLAAGYIFQHPDAESALRWVYGKVAEAR
jgi:uncharacterized protein (TIGR01777 family)